MDKCYICKSEDVEVTIDNDKKQKTIICNVEKCGHQRTEGFE